jgi:hypothetical protein
MAVITGAWLTGWGEVMGWTPEDRCDDLRGTTSYKWIAPTASIFLIGEELLFIAKQHKLGLYLIKKRF